MPLLNGTADLILLFIIAWALQDRVESTWQWSFIGGVFASLYTALPFGTYLVGYFLTASVARLLKRRVWKAPFLAMLAATFIGTVIVHSVSLIARLSTGVNIPVLTALNVILLPGLLLNLLLAIPVFSIMRDMATWLYPEELEA